MALDVVGINARDVLARWLAESLEDVDDVALERFFEVARKLETYSVATDDRDASSRARVRALVDRLHGTESARRVAVLSEGLRELFVDTTLTEASYRAHADALRSGATLAERRRAREPLPTMDALFVLGTDSRDLSQAERAAVLCAAALELHRNGFDAHVRPEGRVIGTTLAPGIDCDELIAASDDLAVLVLSGGVPYVLRVGSASVDARELAEAFANVLRANVALSGTGDRMEVAPLVTAAGRVTCRRVRDVLERVPDNARAFREIESCAFAVALDESNPLETGASEIERLEALSRRLFDTFSNRWFGMTNIAVDADGEAGVIASYTRGLEAIQMFAYCEALLAAAEQIVIRPATEGAAPRHFSAERIAFHAVDLGDLAAQASVEIATSFHPHRAFYEIGFGTRLARTLEVPANALLQYLTAFAARDAFALSTLPAVSHAVSTHDGAGLAGGLDWVTLSNVEAAKLLDDVDAATASSDTRALAGLVAVARAHGERVVAARNGYSPAGFLRAPEGEVDAILYDYFLELGARGATGYRSHLFRATRRTGTMDILTSTLRLSPSVRYCGRPGATNSVASLFGAHVVIGAESTRLFFIPNVAYAARLPALYRALERWTLALAAFAARRGARA